MLMASPATEMLNGNSYRYQESRYFILCTAGQGLKGIPEAVPTLALTPRPPLSRCYATPANASPFHACAEQVLRPGVLNASGGTFSQRQTWDPPRDPVSGFMGDPGGDVTPAPERTDGTFPCRASEQVPELPCLHLSSPHSPVPGKHHGRPGSGKEEARKHDALLPPHPHVFISIHSVFTCARRGPSAHMYELNLQHVDNIFRGGLKSYIQE